MISYAEAKIARETLVDVGTPEGDLGCVAFISTRDGVRGAYIDVGNPLGESGWFPLEELTLGGSSRKTVDFYLLRP